MNDKVIYTDMAPWPEIADVIGSPLYGSSLHRISTGSWGRDATSWVAADPTPGTVDITTTAEVVGRHVFYNDSVFDGRDPAAVSCLPESSSPWPKSRA